MNSPIIPSENSTFYYSQLLTTLTDHNLTDNQRYFSLQLLLRGIVTYLLREERQYFANDFARLLFLSDKYSFSAQLTEALQKNRTVFSRIRQGKTSPQKSSVIIAQKAIILLLGFCSETPIPKELESLQSIIVDDKPYTLFEEHTELIQSIRLEITEVPEIVEKHGFPLQVKALADNGIEWLVLFTQEFVRQAVFLRVGITVHCTTLVRAQTSDARLLSTKQTLLIIEPDVLIDVTDIAECFNANTASPYFYFVKRIQPKSKTSREMLLGTIINNCFDIVMTKPDVTIEDAVRDSLLYKPISAIAALGDESEESIVKEVQPHFNNLREIAKTLRYDVFTVEASFISPLFGLQGRLDIMLEYDDDPRRKTIIELKSGKPPSAFNRNGNVAYGMWKNHEAQILCYNLLLDTAYEARKGDSSVLYSRDNETPLRNAPNEIQAKRSVLEVRNAIVLAEQEILNKKFRVFSGILPDTFKDAPDFIRNRFMGAHNFLSKLSEVETVYFRAMYTFLLRESYTARCGGESEENDCGFSGLWRKTYEEKTQSFSIITDLILDTESTDFEKMYIHFFRTQSGRPTSLREGDIVLIYPLKFEKNILSGQIIKGSIRTLTDEKLVVSVRNKLIHTSLFLSDSDKQWVLEPDYMDSSSAVLFNLITEFLSSPEKIKNTLLGVNAPTHKTRMVLDTEALKNSCENLPTLHEEQKHILCSMMSGMEYFLLQGPPGTGKTSVMLKWCARIFYIQEKGNVLILAYTNRATDEILRSVLSVIPDEEVIRLGSKDNTEYPQFTLDTMSKEHSLQFVREKIQKARFVVGTVSSVITNTDIFSIKDFSLLIVDEAAQIIEPNIVAFAARIGRTILIGDEKQLPAVIVQNESQTTIQHPLTDTIHFRDMRMSLFERLLRCCHSNSWNYAFAMLSRQGRMHRTIADFVNKEFYGNALKTVLPWQNEEKSELYASMKTLPKVLQENRTLFIPVYNSDKGKVNTHEAEIAAHIATLCSEALGNSFSEQSIGIITPFRAQILEIKKRLKPTYRNSITVDTVERFQGSERDIIILSFAVNHSAMLRSVSNPVEINGVMIDRKLNVAITRARKQLIVIGNPEILSEEPILKNFIDSLEKAEI